MRAKKLKENAMPVKENSVVAIYNTHTDAEEAIRELQKNDLNMKQVSILGKGYQTEEQALGYYNTGDRVKFWGKLGAFWGGLWGLLMGHAFLLIPGVGPIMIMGPLVGWLAGALEGATVIGGLSAIGAALFSIGIPKDSIIEYETSLKAHKFLIVYHGTQQEVDKAHEILNKSNAINTPVHHD
jgi:uncharacterized membrane protein